MVIDKQHTACFSGYRPEKFSFSLEDTTCTEYKHLCSNINGAITEALQLGYKAFLCGMGRGFDLLCASAVINFRKKKKYSHLKLIAVLPFAEHGFSGEWGKLHNTVRTNADWEVCISPEGNGYIPKSYHLRNNYMVNNSSRLICYWNGQKGGTAHTVRLAERHGLAVCDLCSKTP